MYAVHRQQGLISQQSGDSNRAQLEKKLAAARDAQYIRGVDRESAVASAGLVR